jgi:hypothetical protein
MQEISFRRRYSELTFFFSDIPRVFSSTQFTPIGNPSIEFSAHISWKTFGIFYFFKLRYIFMLQIVEVFLWTLLDVYVLKCTI